MNPRVVSFIALAQGALAVLGSLTLAYGLVYPSGAPTRSCRWWQRFSREHCAPNWPPLSLAAAIAARAASQSGSSRCWR